MEFLINKTSKQVWIRSCRTILDKRISITANTPVVKYTTKCFKALEYVFHAIPADKTFWTEKWHFAPLCSGAMQYTSCNVFKNKIATLTKKWAVKDI